MGTVLRHSISSVQCHGRVAHWEPVHLFPFPIPSQAVGSAQKYYNNEHIYPFMYLAGFHYRHRNVRDALGAWAEAAQVMQE